MPQPAPSAPPDPLAVPGQVPGVPTPAAGGRPAPTGRVAHRIRSTPALPSPRRRSKALHIAVLLAVVIGGTAAAWSSRSDARHEAQRRQELVAAQTGSLAAATVQQVFAAMSSTHGLGGAAGQPDKATFDTIAAGLLAEAPVSSVVYVPAPRTDGPAGGNGEPAGQYRVQWQASADTADRSWIGADLDAQPRLDTLLGPAIDSGRTVLSPPIDMRHSEHATVLVIEPLYRTALPADAGPDQRRQAHTGFIAASLTGEDLLEALLAQVDESIDVNVHDAGELLATTPEPPANGSTAARVVGDRTWLITVEDLEADPPIGPWWILVATVALAAAVAALGRRTLRHESATLRDTQSARLDAELAMLTTGLSGAETADDVIAFLADHLARPLDVAQAAIGVMEPGGILRLYVGGSSQDQDPDRFTNLRLDARLPLCEAVRTGSTIVIPDPELVADRWPDAAEPWQERGFASAVKVPLRNRSGEVIGGIGVSWDDSAHPDSGTTDRLAMLAEIVAQALERAQLSDAVRRDAVRSRRLAELAEAATAVGTTEQIARILAERASAVVDGVGGHIGMLSRDRTALRVIHHSSFEPAMSARYGRQNFDEHLPPVTAFTTGEPVLLANPEEMAEQFPAIHDDLADLGIQAVAVLPMLTEHGTPFGTLGITWAEPQHFDHHLLSTLHTMTDLCTTSLTRTWLTDRTARRTSTLATLARHLSVARTFDEVSKAIARHGPAALDADVAVIGLVEGDRFLMRVPDPHAEMAGQYADLSLDDDFPALEALRRNELITFRSAADAPPHEIVRRLTNAGIRSGACAPLTTATGEALGVLSVLWSHTSRFDKDLQERIHTVADLAEQTAERARLFDAEHHVTQDLQRRVLSDIPDIAGITTAARYEPATSAIGMGGDWYDGVRLDDGRLCLVLGDVSGHGLGAVAAMTQLRAVVRSLVATGISLPEVVARTSAQIRDDAGLYTTLLIATVNVADNTLSYVSAGHPPPLLRHPDGRIELLSEGHHPMLGLDVRPRSVGRAAFLPGSTLVAYTDGLIERRDKSIDVAIEGLAENVAGTPAASAAGLADRLLELHRHSDTYADDIALVVICRDR